MRTCRYCGSALRVYASRVRDGKGQYCNRQCEQAYRSSAFAQQERFWSYVDKKNRDDCWLWHGSVLQTNGYGQFRVSPKDMTLAHRYAWVIVNGPIPDSMLICHSCDIRYALDDRTYRRCVNPQHLFLGNNADNMADMVHKNRQRHGEQAPGVKLTKQDVLAIRGLYDKAQRNGMQLAEEYHVSTSLIYAILLRQVWNHI